MNSEEIPCSLRIRTATDADHPRVLAVADEWWGGRSVSWPAQRLFFEHFADTSLVAEDPHGLAGFLIGFLSQSLPDEAHIHMVATRSDRRRSGLARDLYARFFDLASAAGRGVATGITAPRNDDRSPFIPLLASLQACSPITPVPERTRLSFAADSSLTTCPG